MLACANMDDNTTYSNLPITNMLPLDMLAEVAAETLKNDPSLSCRSSSAAGFPRNAVNKLSPPKRSTNSEYLTLEQIRHLSEKMLLEMFSEHSSDEIRRNFSYQCYLMPEKCDKIFSSFGNETKARFQMKAHLLSHIAQLLAESKASGLQSHSAFVAEPLSVRRRKKLQEGKKRKRTKCPNKRPKSLPAKQCSQRKDISPMAMTPEVANKNEKFSVSVCNNFIPPAVFNRKHSTRVKKNARSNVISKTVEKENHGTCISSLEELYLAVQKSDSNYQASIQNDIEKIKLKDGCQDIRPNITGRSLKNNFGMERFTKSKPGVKSHDAEMNETFSVQFKVESSVNGIVNEHSISPTSTNADLFAYANDHTYTSVNGKTYNVDSSEDDKNATKRNKDNRKKARKFCCVPAQLIISTDPFPFVYEPLLPQASEVREIGNCNKRPFEKFTNRNNASVKKVCSSLQSSAARIKKQVRCRRVNKLVIPEEMEADTEDDENVPCTPTTKEYFDNAVCLEEICANDVNAKSSVINLIGKLQSGTTQNRERKVALKCIRALRSKSKDERGPLICRICKDKSFTAQATLMYHYRSHAGIKPFICTVCEATFTRQHSLNYHMLIHNNKSRFVCDDCGRNFRHPSHYKEHLRRHTGETPYQCSDCSLRFKTRNTYKRHLKTRHGKILTARGIRILSVEEFNKVRTSPRKRTLKSGVAAPGIQFISFTPVSEIPQM